MATLFISIAVFAIVIVLVVARPKGLNEAAFALPGAAILLLAGAVGWNDVSFIWGMVWNATLSLIGIMVLTALMDQIGFFRWAALHIVRKFHSRRLLLLSGLAAMSGLITTFFNNDGTILIMIPIVLEVTALLGMGIKARIAFLFTVGLMADTASATLVVSNLTNILTADYFSISFGEYAGHMAFPGLTAAVATVIVCAAAFAATVKNDEASQANESESPDEFPEPRSRIRHLFLFRLSWIILALILIGYAFSESLGVPVSIIACAGASALWIAAALLKASDSRELLLRTPWLIVAFALAMNLIVYSLYAHGGTDWFRELLEPVAHSGTAASVFGSGLLFSLLAACMNNLPAVLVSSLSITHVQGSDILPFASLLGMSVGAKLTPIGSLATLLWLGLLRRGGVRMTWGHYLRLALPLTAAVLLLSLAALWLQTVLFQ